jgi:hypothetical protein
LTPPGAQVSINTFVHRLSFELPTVPKAELVDLPAALRRMVARAGLVNNQSQGVQLAKIQPLNQFSGL